LSNVSPLITGTDPMKIGLQQDISKGLMELAIANGSFVHLSLAHVKSVHIP
jgi:hypothetical protein